MLKISLLHLLIVALLAGLSASVVEGRRRSHPRHRHSRPASVPVKAGAPAFDPVHFYCQAPFPTSASYVPATNPATGGPLNLVGLALVHRHGDRASVTDLNSYDQPADFCATNQTLGLQAADITANISGNLAGDGRHIKTITNWPQSVSNANPFGDKFWKGNCASGQLTTTGVEQLMTLGVNLRNIYVDQLGFLPSDLTEAVQTTIRRKERESPEFASLSLEEKTSAALDSIIYLRTTDIWRTRESAQSLLSGLFPLSNPSSPRDAKQRPVEARHFASNARAGVSASGEPIIPANYFPAEIETMYSNPAACAALNTATNTLYTYTPWTDHLKNATAQQFWADFDRILGPLSAYDTADYMSAVDVMQVRICHDQPLPCNPKNASDCLQPWHAEMAMDEGSWEFSYLYNAQGLGYQAPISTMSELSGLLTIGGLVSVISDFLSATGNNAIGNASTSIIGTPLLAHFSAHDTTVAPLLSYLNQVNYYWPPYASNVIFEVLQDANSTSSSLDDIYVRILNNGAPLTMSYSLCNNVQICSLSAFLEDFAITQNMNQICNSPVSQFSPRRR